MLEKVISGGQTGADRIGLEEAKKAGLKTGGEAPKYYRTERGSDNILKSEFGLTESDGYSYLPRTKKNILDSDATVLFGNMFSTGSKMTIKFCKDFRKPFISNPSALELVKFIEFHGVVVLNVAGNRASKLSQTQMDEIREKLQLTFAILKNNNDGKNISTV